MDLDKYYKWLSHINSTLPLKFRGLIINGKEAWELGEKEEKEEKERILEIIRTVSFDNKSCIDEATTEALVSIVLTRIYNKILGSNLTEQEFIEGCRNET